MADDNTARPPPLLVRGLNTENNKMMNFVKSVIMYIFLFS